MVAAVLERTSGTPLTRSRACPSPRRLRRIGLKAGACLSTRQIGLLAGALESLVSLVAAVVALIGAG